MPERTAADMMCSETVCKRVLLFTELVDIQVLMLRYWIESPPLGEGHEGVAGTHLELLVASFDLPGPKPSNASLAPLAYGRTMSASVTRPALSGYRGVPTCPARSASAFSLNTKHIIMNT